MLSVCAYRCAVSSIPACIFCGFVTVYLSCAQLCEFRDQYLGWEYYNYQSNYTVMCLILVGKVKD